MTDPSELDLLPPSASPGLGQHFAFGAALFFYACAILSLGGIIFRVGDLGGEHPIIASLGASVVFFIGGGIVLHVIGRAKLPYLGFRAPDPNGCEETVASGLEAKVPRDPSGPSSRGGRA